MSDVPKIERDDGGLPIATFRINPGDRVIYTNLAGLNIKLPSGFEYYSNSESKKNGCPTWKTVPNSTMKARNRFFIRHPDNPDVEITVLCIDPPAAGDNSDSKDEKGVNTSV